ncbi:MAG: hypothetical protein MZW92_11565 [Comamonadaceae bacterium]|nr:hypothetical protein [Comamonadaceae bacterium]
MPTTWPTLARPAPLRRQRQQVTQSRRPRPSPTVGPDGVGSTAIRRPPSRTHRWADGRSAPTLSRMERPAGAGGQRQATVNPSTQSNLDNHGSIDQPGRHRQFQRHHHPVGRRQLRRDRAGRHHQHQRAILLQDGDGGNFGAIGQTNTQDATATRGAGAPGAGRRLTMPSVTQTDS